MVQRVFELLWLQTIMKELILFKEESLSLFCDNKTVISITHNSGQHDRTKHIDIDRHFIKEKVVG